MQLANGSQAAIKMSPIYDNMEKQFRDIESSNQSHISKMLFIKPLNTDVLNLNEVTLLN